MPPPPPTTPLVGDHTHLACRVRHLAEYSVESPKPSSELLKKLGSPHLPSPISYLRRAAAFILLLLTACSKKPTEQEHRLTGNTMGTTWTLIAIQENPPPPIQPRLDELESIFSTWRPDSAIQRFNQNQSTDWQPVPSELAEIATHALRFAKLSDGAFDPTIAPLLALWGFGPGKHPRAIPPAEAIAAAKQHTGWQKLQVQTNPPALRKSAPSLQIDLSALVEGYALDDLATTLTEANCHHFLLEIGGEMLARGHKADGTPWIAGIQLPGDDKTQLATAATLEDEAISTSGVYRQFWESPDHQQFPHVLDARTGRPISHTLASVTVKAASALQADGWSTTLLILGPQHGQTLAQQEHISAFFQQSKSDNSTRNSSP